MCVIKRKLGKLTLNVIVIKKKKKEKRNWPARRTAQGADVDGNFPEGGRQG